jgi:hypothetical protein
MKTPLVFGRPTQGVPSVLAVAVQPGAKLAISVLAVALFPARHSLPRQTRSLVHHSVAIPPQTNSNSEPSLFNSRGITNLEGLTSLGHHRIHRHLLSHDLSGRGDLLGSSVLATEALKDDATHVSGHGVMVLHLIGLAKGQAWRIHRKSHFLIPRRQVLQQPVRCSWEGGSLLEVMGSS